VRNRRRRKREKWLIVFSRDPLEGPERLGFSGRGGNAGSAGNRHVGSILRENEGR